MGGLLVIEDPTDSSVPQHIQQVSCPLNCAHDIQMVFQSTLIYARGGGFATLQIAMQDNLFRFYLRSLHHFPFFSFYFLVSLPDATGSSACKKVVYYASSGGHQKVVGTLIALIQYRRAANSQLQFYQLWLGGPQSLLGSRFVPAQSWPKLWHSTVVTASVITHARLCKVLKIMLIGITHKILDNNVNLEWWKL